MLDCCDELDEGPSALFDDGGASACDPEDLEGSMPDLRSSCGDGAALESSAGMERVLRSSSASASTAIRVPTLTPFAPSFCCMGNCLVK